jgi:hypothetical protein
MWYIIALSVIIWLVVWGFLTKQYVMSFLVILISWISFFIENNTEEHINVEINPLWIKVNSNFYEYSKIWSFSIVYDSWNAVLLRLILIKKWIKFVDLNIDNEIAIALKEILPNFIKEGEDGDFGVVDKVIKILKL